MVKRYRTVSTRVEEPIKTAFDQYCASCGKSAHEVLKGFILDKVIKPGVKIEQRRENTVARPDIESARSEIRPKTEELDPSVPPFLA